MKSTFVLLSFSLLLVRGQEWGPCPGWSSTDLYVSECRGFIAPLNWEQPDGRTIELFIARFRSRLDPTENHDQLWLLNGGPGGRLDGFYIYADFFAQFMNATYVTHPLDVYIVEHRGVGYSSSLNCTQFDMEDTGPCLQQIRAQWGTDGLSHFNTLNAGYDVAFLIDELKPVVGNVPRVFVYGVSYGTIWLDRYLHVAPTQADAVVMDSLAFKADIAQYDILVNEVGRDFMAQCNINNFCGQQFSGRAASRVIFEVLQDIRAGTLECLEHVPSLSLKVLTEVFGLMTLINEARPLIAPVTKRLERCNEDDRVVLERLFSQFAPLKHMHRLPIPHPLGIFNSYNTKHHQDEEVEVLGLNIIASEIIGVQTDGVIPTLEELQFFIENDAIFQVDTGVPSVTFYENWELYDPPLYQIPAKIEIPLLKLNGDLDPQTSLTVAALSSALYPGDLQIFPRQVHGIALNSATTISPWPCGLEVIMNFFLTEDHEIDVSCVEFLQEIDFQAEMPETQEVALEFLGTANVWGQD